jgi:glycosyltransferase involved in cell wall biosynthesis
MKKVVRVIGRMSGGGPPHQAAYLHKSLRSSFDTVLVIGTVEKDEQDMRYLLADSPNVVEIPSMSRSLNAWSDFVSLYAITRLLVRERPDVVHTHTPKAGLLGRMAAFLAHVPVRVHTYHGHGFSGYLGKVGSRAVVTVERILNRLTTHVIAISESQAHEITEKFRVVSADKVTVIRNGIDLSRFSDADKMRAESRRRLGVEDGELLVVWAGRFTPIKDVPLLLKVVEMAGRLPKVKFMVLGEGPMREAIMDAARRFSNLQFGGWREDMKPIWAAADVCLLTSKNEGTPMSLIEAMAVGRPFVATAVGGIPDLAVQPHTPATPGCRRALNGFLTSRDAEAIVWCIETLALESDLRKCMGEHGRRFALANFSQDRLSREIVELYESLLAKSESRTRGL